MLSALEEAQWCDPVSTLIQEITVVSHHWTLVLTSPCQAFKVQAVYDDLSSIVKRVSGANIVSIDCCASCLLLLLASSLWIVMIVLTAVNARMEVD